MKSRKLLPVLLWCFVAGSEAAEESIAFRNVHVVPMDEERVLRDYTVVVSGERIQAVGPAADVAIPEGARVVEGGGRYLLPGLAEMHAHVPGPLDRRYLEEVLFLYVANGVTTARGMLGQPAHLDLRGRLERHEVLAEAGYTRARARTSCGASTAQTGYPA
jgi:cytosine/adenosine deaminase-related metal-dependent hydrolase